jgi:hypothetical protein
MEYLVLAGSDIKAGLSQTLGEFAPFFWSVLAPIGLTVLWVWSLWALWGTWRREGGGEELRGGFVPRLLVSLFLVAMIMGAGTTLEYLLLGDGFVHARILGGVVELFGVSSVPDPSTLPSAPGSVG